jgi:predicted PurR-regulated permease PerM
VEQANLLYSFVTLIIMLIPLGLLFWRISRIVFQVELNKENINGMGKKIDDQIRSINATINNHEKDIAERIDELSKNINEIKIIQARIEEKIISLNEIKDIAVGAKS